MDIQLIITQTMSTCIGIGIRITAKPLNYFRNNYKYLISTFTAVKCDDPGIVPNTMRSAGDFNYDSSVTYTCNDGYRLTPTVADPQSFTITCGSDGTWDDTLQQCIGTFCIDISGVQLY